MQNITKKKISNFKYKNIFLSKTFYLIFFCLTFYTLTSKNLEFYYDDWFFVSHFGNQSILLENFNKLKDIYLVRPIGLIYLIFLSLFNYENVAPIFILNILIWLFSGLIISKSIKKIIPNFSENFFLVFFLFPSISATFIYSPIIQGLSTISIFLWSISIWFICKSNNNLNILLSIIFVLLSIFSYEISVSLVPINIFFYLANKKIIYERFKLQIFSLAKIFLLFLILIFCFYLIQNFLGKISHVSTIKYGFFEKDFFENLIKYFFKPFELFFIEIPIFWINGLKNFINNYQFWDLILIILINLILINDSKNKIYKDFKFAIAYNFSLCFVFLGIFLIYLVATSVPDLNGYYNRGLLGLHIFIVFFLIQFNFYKSYLKKIFLFLLIIIINMNLISLLEQNKIHKKNSSIRQDIINKTKKVAGNNYLIFTNFNTYSKNKYNLIPIFSDEVFDYKNSINYRYKEKYLANRIYNNPKCKNILFFKNNYLSGIVPSRNRKTKDDLMINFYKIDINQKNSTSIVIYDYESQNFKVGKINEIKDLLVKIFNCE